MQSPTELGTKAARRQTTAMRELLDRGQSVWLDYLRRGMTRSGELASMIDDGLRGMTSNPTIFEQAIAGSPDYDEALRERSIGPMTDREVFDALAIQDVQEAADAFRRIYDDTNGGDGFVSIEVGPEFARDTRGTIIEARRLWRAVGRPNAMIKIPGTREGWPAIECCLREGININITLLFSVEHYQEVAYAYLRALEARVAEGLPIDRPSSVASVFVSRVDTEVDKRMAAWPRLPGALHGRVAVANARLVYDAFRAIFNSPRWRELESRGARIQRPLWASTGTKNPAYSDVLYVEMLIGPDTISTVPLETLRLFEHHGVVDNTLPGNVARARLIMRTLEAGGIDFNDVNATLEREAIDKFSQSMKRVLGVIAAKRSALSETSGSSRPDASQVNDSFTDTASSTRVE
jgi:transaldolase